MRRMTEAGPVAWAVGWLVALVGATSGGCAGAPDVRCAERGGRYQWMVSGGHCHMPARDAGRSCSDTSECEYHCTCPPDAPEHAGAATRGTCARFPTLRPTGASCRLVHGRVVFDRRRVD